MLACRLVRLAAVNLTDLMMSPCGTPPDPLKNPARKPPPPLPLYCCWFSRRLDAQPTPHQRPPPDRRQTQTQADGPETRDMTRQDKTQRERERKRERETREKRWTAKQHRAAR